MRFMLKIYTKKKNACVPAYSHIGHAQLSSVISSTIFPIHTAVMSVMHEVIITARGQLSQKKDNMTNSYCIQEH